MTTKQDLSRPKLYGSTRVSLITSISLEKIIKIQAYLLDEIEVSERLAKEMKLLNTITSIGDADLLTPRVITGGFSIATFASCVGLTIAIALGGTSVQLFSCNSYYTKIL